MRDPEPTEKDSGSNCVTGKMAPVIITVEMINYHFTVFSMLSSVTVKRFVAKKVVTKETRIPTQVIKSGK